MTDPILGILPVVVPLLVAAAALLLEPLRPHYVPALSLLSMLTTLVVALMILAQANEGRIAAYLVGNWPAPFGIVLAVDRFSALMLALAALLGLASVLYARGGDERRGPHFHALLQFQLMGLNGAFLTADLFNLFVFFEVLLIASYGLLLHGAGAARLKASIHYVSFNLTGSALFLIGVSMLYGLTGTLNMADLAQRLVVLDSDAMVLARVAGLLLLVVFAVKAALLPMYFWLPESYSAASASVAALFAIMTKMGVYAIIRLTTLVFGGAMASHSNALGDPWIAWLAIGTLALAAVGALAAQRLRILVAYLIVMSTGTLLLGVGLAGADAVAAVLFYLVPSTIVAAAFFLLIDRVAAARGEADDQISAAPWRSPRFGSALLFFGLAVSVAGLPPLGGFIGKAQLLAAASATPLAAAAWAAIGLSSLASLIALTRAGSELFWKSPRTEPSVDSAMPAGHAQLGAIVLLALVLIGTSVFAGPLSRYTRAAAEQLLRPDDYIAAILGAQPFPQAWNPRAPAKP